MAFYIPIGEDADNIQRIQLGTETYAFRFRWNTLEGAWYLYLGLFNQDPKIQIKLVVGMDLLDPHRAYQEIPEGVLYLIDTDKDYGRPERYNVGIDKRFKLFYADLDEDISGFFQEE